MTDLSGRGAGSAPAVSVCAEETSAAAPAARPSVIRTEVLRQRADYLRAASALRQAAPGFLLQARERRAEEPVLPDTIRVGFTCSKKIGNAVTRNRAKRRLRALARLGFAGLARPGWDYVLVGRPGATVSRDFAALQADLIRALTDIHSGKARPQKPRLPRGKAAEAKAEAKPATTTPPTEA